MLIHDTKAHCIAILIWLNFHLNETFSVSVWFSTLSRGGNNVCFYQLLSKTKCFIRQTHFLLSLSLSSFTRLFVSFATHVILNMNSVSNIVHTNNFGHYLLPMLVCARRRSVDMCVCMCDSHIILEIYADFCELFWVNRISHVASLRHTNVSLLVLALTSLLFCS